MIFQYYPQPPKHNFTFELNKDMNFSSAHFIPDHEAGKCSDLHGHTYFCNITIGGNVLDKLGFLVNFSTLKKLIHGRFDHRVINEYMNDFPSTELVAKEIWTSIQEYLNTTPNSPTCLQVVLRETPTSYVIYRPKSVVDSNG